MPTAIEAHLALCRSRGVTDYRTERGDCRGCGECRSRFLPMSRMDERGLVAYVEGHGIEPRPEPEGALDLTCPLLSDDRECEVHRVLFVDGIRLARDLVVLIAHDGEHVVSWYMARAEASRAWEALMAPIPAPEAVVCDGGTGFESARRRAWPGARVQRCLFHVFSQVKRYTTSRPRLQAGREPCALAIELMHLDTLRQADWWVERYLQWCGFWADFLEDVSYVDGRRVFTHERLRKARSSLSRLVSQGTLFTYLDPGLASEGPLPRTNNAIEGGVNALLRDMLRNHRGMSAMRRVKAVFWWCYLHTESPRPARDILASMPTDDDIDLLYRTYSASPKRGGRGPGVGRPGRVGGAPPQRPVPILAGLGQVFY